MPFLDRVARHNDPWNCDSPLSSRCDSCELCVLFANNTPTQKTNSYSPSWPSSTRFSCGMNDEPMASGPDASALAASDTVIIVAYHLPIIIT